MNNKDGRQENGNNSTILQQIDEIRGGNRDLEWMSDFPSYALPITITSHDMSCRILHSPKNIKNTKIKEKLTGSFFQKNEDISTRRREREERRSGIVEQLKAYRMV